MRLCVSVIVSVCVFAHLFVSLFLSVPKSTRSLRVTCRLVATVHCPEGAILCGQRVWCLTRVAPEVTFILLRSAHWGNISLCIIAYA